MDRFVHRLLPSSIPGLGLVALAAGLLVLLIFGVSTAVAAPPAPPHPLDGYGDCLMCHGAGKSATAVPADHSAYTTATCAVCHKPAVTTAPPPQSGSPAPAAPAAQPSGNQACLSCHQDKSLTVKLAGGDSMSLYLDADKFQQSVHGRRLACTDCHTGIAGYPHPKVQYASRREYTKAYYESCKRCHFENYTKTLDSVHFSALSSGEAAAPVCSDCHGSHYVAKPAEPRHTVSGACGSCHQSVYQDYGESVHGRALSTENPDVPVCTTCHGVHNIADASSISFRLASTNLCARCHEDRQLMAKYGLSPNVIQTYLDDFHGRTVGFYQKQNPATQPIAPVCVDCHGIHDIKSAQDPDSPTIKANLQSTCQKCHPDASTNFPSAWLGHYEPNPDKAPLTYYVRLYYWLLIPMMIGGLGLHIVLDLWRIARNR